MRQAVVTLDEDVLAEWGLEIFSEAGIRDVEVLSCEGARGVVRLHVEDPMDGARLDEMDAVQWWEHVADSTDGSVYILEAGADDPGDLNDDRYPMTERVEVADDGLQLTYVGPQARIRDELRALDAAGIDISLEELRGYRVRQTASDALTDRQREVLEVAFDRGYYEVPRRATTDDLAAELGLDDSTVSEHLQRAERNVLGTVLAGAT